MKKLWFKIIGIILFSFFPLLLISEGFIVFEDEHFDFGEIKEEIGKIEHRYEFTNVGDEPIEINNIESS